MESRRARGVGSHSIRVIGMHAHHNIHTDQSNRPPGQAGVVKALSLAICHGLQVGQRHVGGPPRGGLRPHDDHRPWVTEMSLNLSGRASRDA